MANNQNNDLDLQARLKVDLKQAQDALQQFTKDFNKNFSKRTVLVDIKFEQRSKRQFDGFIEALKSFSSANLKNARSELQQFSQTVNAFGDPNKFVRASNSLRGLINSLNSVRNSSTNVGENLRREILKINSALSQLTIGNNFRQVGSFFRELGMATNGLNKVAQNVDGIVAAVQKLIPIMNQLKQSGVAELFGALPGNFRISKSGNPYLAPVKIVAPNEDEWNKIKGLMENRIGQNPIKAKIKPDVDKSDWQKTVQRFQNLLIAVSFGQFTEDFKRFAGQIVTDFGKIQSARTTIDTVYGGGGRGGNYFQFLKQYEQQTPFEFEEVMKGGTQMAAMRDRLASLGMKPEDMVKLAGELSTLSGGRFDEATKGLGRVLSGSAEGLEILRNQFMVSPQVLRQFGVYEGSQGFSLKSDADVQAVIKAIQGFVQSQTGGTLAERRAQNVEGVMSTFYSQLFNTRASLMEPIADTVFVPLVKGATDFVKSLEDANPMLRASLGLVSLAAAGVAELAQKLSSILLVVVGAANAGIFGRGAQVTTDVAGNVISTTMSAAAYRKQQQQMLAMQGLSTAADVAGALPGKGGGGSLVGKAVGFAEKNLPNFLNLAALVAVFFTKIKTTILGVAARFASGMAAAGAGITAATMGPVIAIVVAGLSMLVGGLVADMLERGRQAQEDTGSEGVKKHVDQKFRERITSGKDTQANLNDQEILSMTPEDLLNRGITAKQLSKAKQRIEARDQALGVDPAETQKKLDKIKELEAVVPNEEQLQQRQMKIRRDIVMARISSGQLDPMEEGKLLQAEKDQARVNYEKAVKASKLLEDPSKDTNVQAMRAAFEQASAAVVEFAEKVKQKNVELGTANINIQRAQGKITQGEVLGDLWNRANSIDQNRDPLGYKQAAAQAYQLEFDLAQQKRRWAIEQIDLTKKHTAAKLESIRMETQELRRQSGGTPEEMGQIAQIQAAKEQAVKYQAFLGEKKLILDVRKLRQDSLDVQVSQLRLAMQEELNQADNYGKNRKLIEEKYNLQIVALRKKMHLELVQFKLEELAALQANEMQRAQNALSNAQAINAINRGEVERGSERSKWNSKEQLMKMTTEEYNLTKKVGDLEVKQIEAKWKKESEVWKTKLGQTGLSKQQLDHEKEMFRIAEEKYKLDLQAAKDKRNNQLLEIGVRRRREGEDIDRAEAAGNLDLANQVLEQEKRGLDFTLGETKNPSRKLDILKAQLTLEKTMARNRAAQTVQQNRYATDSPEYAMVQKKLAMDILEIQKKYLDTSKQITSEFEQQNAELAKRYFNEDGTTMGEVFGAMDLAQNMKNDSDYFRQKAKFGSLKSRRERIFGQDIFDVKTQTADMLYRKAPNPFIDHSWKQGQLEGYSVKVDDINLNINLTLDGKNVGSYNLQNKAKNANYPPGRKPN